MLRYNYKNFGEKEYLLEPNLNDLLRRLEKGMKLQGRIVECYGRNMYLLRIWGYNILTESEYFFNKFEEVNLVVRGIEPHLILDISKEREPDIASVSKTNG